MTHKDHQGFALTGASPAAADSYRLGLEAYHRYAGDAIGALDAALAESPRFVMAHLLKTYILIGGTNAEMSALGVQQFAQGRDLPANRREQGHMAAIEAMLKGEIRRAGRILEDLSLEHPHDSLALQAGQLCDFLLGDSRMLRDRSARVLPAWSRDMPHYHAVLAMLAFGLEETGLYDQAEAAGREAIALEPRDNWAQHAVAHVLEMQDRRAEGVRWMRHENVAWQPESVFAVHNWWHTALFHLGLGEIDEVLALYDGPIFGETSTFAFDMVDAAALLWRLELKGVDVGQRWNRIADAYEGEPHGRYAFDDAHAMIAFVGAGRDAAAQAVIDAQAQALGGPGDNAYFTAEVGLPLIEAIGAYGRADYARAVELLRGVRNKANRFGGSNAQRDLIDLTLIEAAHRAGQPALAQALQAERAAAQPRARSSGQRLAA